jgi:hypothetical protein
MLTANIARNMTASGKLRSVRDKQTKLVLPTTEI